MKILADTSIWIDYFHGIYPEFSSFLEDKNILMHEWVLGELVTGQIQAREDFLRSMLKIDYAELIENYLVYEFIESKKLMGKGLSFIDCQLLASCLVSDCFLLTRDKRLKETSLDLGIARDCFPVRT